MSPFHDGLKLLRASYSYAVSAEKRDRENGERTGKRIGDVSCFFAVLYKGLCSHSAGYEELLYTVARFNLAAQSFQKLDAV